MLVTLFSLRLYQKFKSQPNACLVQSHVISLIDEYDHDYACLLQYTIVPSKAYTRMYMYNFLILNQREQITFVDEKYIQYYTCT